MSVVTTANHILIDLVDTIVHLPYNPYEVFLSKLPALPDSYRQRLESWFVKRAGHLDVLLGDFVEIANGCGLITNRQDILRIWQRAYAAAKFTPGVERFLQQRRTQGVRIAILSNSLPFVNLLLARLKISEMVDHVLLSCDIGGVKPTRRVFHSAIQELGLMPDKTIMIGNSIQKDIRPATEVGLLSAWYKAGSQRLECGEIDWLSRHGHRVSVIESYDPLLIGTLRSEHVVARRLA